MVAAGVSAGEMAGDADGEGVGRGLAANALVPAATTGTSAQRIHFIRYHRTHAWTGNRWKSHPRLAQRCESKIAVTIDEEERTKSRTLDPPTRRNEANESSFDL